MINEHELYKNHVQDKILSLIELDCARSVELFTEHRDYIPPSSIVKEIQIKLKDLEIPSRQRSMRNFNDKSARSSRVIGGRTKLHKKTQFVGKYKRYLKIFLYRYLHMLVGLGDGTDYPEFHDVLVKLYAEFDAIQLQQFLHTTILTYINACNIIKSIK